MSHTVTPSYDIDPYVGIGVLMFTQTRKEVRSLLGEPTKVFRKVPFADTLTDAYSLLGIHIFYDPQDRLESIDVFSPARICFEDIQLLGNNAEEIIRLMEQRGYSHESSVFEEVGISLYIVEKLVDSVTVFRKGCYNMDDPNSQICRALLASRKWRKDRDSSPSCPSPSTTRPQNNN